jgi:hypothetical protein
MGEDVGDLEMTKEIERLTKDTPAWYAGMRARVEARAALEQAEELSSTLAITLHSKPCRLAFL